MLCASVSVRQRLNYENLIIMSNVGAHVKFQFSVSGSAALCYWFFFVDIEHENSVLLALDALDDETKNLAFEISRHNRFVFFNE